MIRVLVRIRCGVWHIVNGKTVLGIHANLRGDVSDLSGDVSGIRGNASGIRGNASGIRGDVSGISGDVSGIGGNIDDAHLTKTERNQGVKIDDISKEW